VKETIDKVKGTRKVIKFVRRTQKWKGLYNDNQNW